MIFLMKMSRSLIDLHGSWQEMFYLTIMKVHIYDIVTISPKNEGAILLMK